MLCSKVVFFALLIHYELIIKVLCNSCREEYELSITCNSFEDLFNYPEPEKQESVTVTGDNSEGASKNNMDVFICDEPMFEKFSSVTSITLNNARVLHISSDCFTGMNALRAIYIERNELTAIEMDTFRTANGNELRAIFLNNNHIIKIDFSDIHLPELTQFEAYSNRVKYVRLKSENLPKVSNMYLGSNHISKFKIESHSMGKLDLSENRIKSFQGSDLVLPNLYLIYLNDNLLSTITPDMIENMPNLQSLYLAHNLLHSVSFPSLKKANYVDLRYNRIKTMDNVNLTTFGQDYGLLFDSNKVFQMESQPPFENLKTFTCDSCYIHIIEPLFFADTFKKLTNLALTSNYLTTANIFKAYEDDLTLDSIALSYNKIKKIGKKDFSRLSELKSLQLDNNDIAVIAEGAFDKLIKLESLLLSNNIIFQLQPNLFDKTHALQVLSISGNNMAFFPIPGWEESTGEILLINNVS